MLLRSILTLTLLAGALAGQEPAAPKPVSVLPPLDTLSPADTARLDSARVRDRNARCWRARPMPECRMIFLTDFGAEFPVTSSRQPSAPPLYQRVFTERLSWSIGLMRNGHRHAHGVSISLVSENLSTFPMIVEYRYRNWLGGSHALDAGIGLRRSDAWIGSGLAPARGYTLMLGYSPTRWVGLTVRRDEVWANHAPYKSVMLGVNSTRVSEYAFKFVALALVDGLLGKIGLHRGDTEPE